MPAAFPCPNPTCNHVFQPEAVKGATSLACPRCGSTFALQVAAAPKPAPPSRPARPSKPSGISTSPPQAVPVAARVPTHLAPPSPPLAVPVAQPVPREPELIPVPNDELVVARPRRDTISLRRDRSAASTRSPLVPMLVVAVVTACVGGAGYYLWRLQQTYAPPDIKGVGNDFLDYNFSVVAPDRPWKQDTDLQDDLKVRLAWSRTGPGNHFVLDYQDYERKQPALSEMLDTILMKLRSQFENLTWQPARPATLDNMEKNTRLSGQPAFLFEFEGDQDEVHQVGECVFLDHRGFGYWIVTWAPEGQKDKASEEWQGLRGAFKVLNQREGWTPRPRDTRTVRGEDYTLSLPADLWRGQKVEEPEPALQGLYIGFDYTNPRERFIAHKSATLHLWGGGRGDDLDAALKAARTRLETQVKESVPDLTVEEQGVKTVSPGDVEGKVVRLRLRNAGSSFDRFVLLAALPAGEQVVVLQGECAMKRRDLWEAELMGVVNSFRPR